MLNAVRLVILSNFLKLVVGHQALNIVVHLSKTQLIIKPLAVELLKVVTVGENHLDLDIIKLLDLQ